MTLGCAVKDLCTLIKKRPVDGPQKQNHMRIGLDSRVVIPKALHYRSYLCPAYRE
ncbi:hypothetical protein COLSTE_00506 [Collinsella stercoris DSM 13279]|uniref:Uncharacterized protein n=1 Tax=Collinsella stercoris DSM 13279 TaxID=445975 RepID=B6G8W5_9ACTN|nr:hypothetical protein COLSTE_00506 [Collinsella stercoris DSM 13279]